MFFLVMESQPNLCTAKIIAVLAATPERHHNQPVPETVEWAIRVADTLKKITKEALESDRASEAKKIQHLGGYQKFNS